jgi:hypothetical protein
VVKTGFFSKRIFLIYIAKCSLLRKKNSKPIVDEPSVPISSKLSIYTLNVGTILCERKPDTVQSCWGERGGGDVTRVEGVDRVNGGGRAPPPSASWAKNSIMTECTQEIRHVQSMNSPVCGSNVHGGPFQREGMGLCRVQGHAFLA